MIFNNKTSVFYTNTFFFMLNMFFSSIKLTKGCHKNSICIIIAKIIKPLISFRIAEKLNGYNSTHINQLNLKNLIVQFYLISNLSIMIKDVYVE